MPDVRDDRKFHEGHGWVQLEAGGAGRFGLDGAAQSPAAFHPIAPSGDGPSRVAGEITIGEIVAQKPGPPRPIEALRQAAQVAQELGVGGARFLGLADQGVEAIDEALQALIGGGLGIRIVPLLVLLRRGGHGEQQ